MGPGPRRQSCEAGTRPARPAYLQHVHLHAAHHADHLAVPAARLLGLEGRVPDVGAEARHAAQEGERMHLEAKPAGRAELRWGAARSGDLPPTGPRQRHGDQTGHDATWDATLFLQGAQGWVARSRGSSDAGKASGAREAWQDGESQRPDGRGAERLRMVPSGWGAALRWAAGGAELGTI